MLENLSAQKAARRLAAFAARQGELRYLPPSSPDGPPIEQAFSKIKALLRGRGARPREALQEAVRRAIAAIPPSDAAAWFAPAGYALPDQGT